MKMIRIRIKATGQVTEMVPNVARSMILGGTAEEVKSSSVESKPVESMAVAAVAERAVAPAQQVAKKPLFGRRRTN